MKSRFVISSLLGLLSIVSAADYGEIEAGTYCVTYESTYLVPVSNQGSLHSTKESGRLPIPVASSLQLTFARNTSAPTQSAFSTDLVASDTSLFVSQSDVAPVSSSLDVEPTDAQSDTVTQLFDTTETVTDRIATSSIDLDVTTTTDAIATSSLSPAGRSVIFLILAPDNNKRDTYRRATRAGFVGNNNPQVCTSATIFLLDQGRLVENGMPISYSGESYKELAGGDTSPGSVTETFEDSGQLVFRNKLLPNGQAGFCQDAKGRVYITFSDEPADCEQVTLRVYDVAQCQNGQLVGDDLTSTVSTVEPPKTTVSQEISSGSTMTDEVQTESSSGEPISSTTAKELTDTIKSSTSSSEPTASSKSIYSTLPEDTSTDSANTVNTEETTSSMSERTSETTVDIEPTTIATTTESSIETSSTETTTNPETATDSGTLTTTEAKTTTAETTTTLPTTTSGAVDTCSDLGGSYITANGQDFSITCNQCYVGISTVVDPFQADSFESCIDSCSSNVECEAVDYQRADRTCFLFKIDDNVTLEANPDYDVAVKQE